MKTMHCPKCNKDRRVSSAAPNMKLCIHCTLLTNRPMLHKCYNAITTQPDLQRFKQEMEGWYPTPYNE